MNKKIVNISAIVFLIVVLCSFQYAFGGISEFQDHISKSLMLARCVVNQQLEKQHIYAVFYDVDGDTVEILKECRPISLRLVGINTPETVDPRKPVQCYGPEASAEAKKLLTGKNIRIEMDPASGTYDKYGRTLAYIYLLDPKTGAYSWFYNEFMIEQGFAYEYTYFNIKYEYQTEFKQVQAEAKENQRGLWSPSTCNGKL
jgi:micrococcal nuclease